MAGPHLEDFRWQCLLGMGMAGTKQCIIMGFLWWCLSLGMGIIMIHNSALAGTTFDLREALLQVAGHHDAGMASSALFSLTV